MQFCEAAHVRFVQNRVLHRDAAGTRLWRSIMPGELWIGNKTFWNECRAVTRIERRVIVGLHDVAEYLRSPFQLTKVRRSIWI